MIRPSTPSGHTTRSTTISVLKTAHRLRSFIDTWEWDAIAIAGYDEILENADGRFTPQLVGLVKGLGHVLGKGSLLAYLVSLALRVTEIYRILKPNGSFYLHCDATASHYLKLVMDAVFCAQGGDFKNEIIWKRTTAHSDTKQGLSRYPTQKPLPLLERIIKSSSNEGDVILDAYCGCGTTIDAAETLGRKWIGIDITYQSIAVVLKRLEDTYGKQILERILLDGIPKDMNSAVALAHRTDDRLRKEFEKWAVLTYTNNRAVINEKKGADGGIDGTAYFRVGKKDNAKIIFQVKSGNVKRSDIATLRGDMEKAEAAMGVLITLEEPTKPMKEDAKAAGLYKHAEMGKSYDRLSIVNVQEIVESGKRLEIPMSLEVLKAAEKAIQEQQLALL